MGPMGGGGADARLALKRTATSSGTIRMSVVGEIDIGTVDQLRSALHLALDEPGVGRLLLDFEPLRFLDSSGIATLIGAYRAADERGIRMGISGCNGTVRHILEVTGVYEVLATDESA
jgi:anti-anti-sigma factor